MNKRNELSEQQAVIEWCEWHLGRYPELKSIYHITNEGKRSIAGGAQLKKAGLKSGVPDLCLPCAHGGYHALYIEMKKDSSCKPTENQKKWIDLLRKQGNFAVVCNSADDAIEIIQAYMSLPETEVYRDNRRN